jgi:CBS domain-containing protein
VTAVPTGALARDIMTPAVTCPVDTPVREVAEQMRDHGTADVLVTREGGLIGVVTARDIVLRGVAGRHDLDTLVAGQICSDDIVTVSIDTPVDDIRDAIRGSSVERLPVLDGQWPVGVVRCDSPSPLHTGST